ncbi:hypothetical protein GN958_ATG15294 [Phytophthora infestans]|uniref:M96 mating-specific protein family n=1 Tax=Phytophthora infestans TaxID=4787 RepID=A0A8S9U5H5_PHYIN|nr:hypothetical protein GN958_ATG15294 [Phytophthora infestans]
MDASNSPKLRRIHSLEFHNYQESTPNSIEDDLGIEAPAAAQMVEFFDINKLLSDVSTPFSSAPRPQVLDEGKHEGFVQTEYHYLPDLTSVALTKTASGGDISEASDDSFRETRKDEIIELREAVEVLTEQLDSLKATPCQATQTHNGPGLHLNSQPNQSLWKYAAIRQLGRRRKAEEDNATLREMLEMQVQEAKCLQRILKRRTKIQMMKDMLGMKRRKIARSALTPSDNAEIFMKMLREADEIYSRVDTHFAEKGVTALPCPGLKRRTNRSAMNDVVLEMTTRNLLPFSLQKTAKTARVVLNNLGTSGLKRIKDVGIQITFHAQESEESRDTLVTSYFSATPGHPLISGAQVRKVMRMSVEEDCAVFIWKMMAEPKLRGSNASIGYQLQSTLQVVMHSGETPTLSGDDSTQLLIHFSASRYETGDPISAEARQPEHMDSGISLWEKLVEHIPYEIESELISGLCVNV